MPLYGDMKEAKAEERQKGHRSSKVLAPTDGNSRITSIVTSSGGGCVDKKGLNVYSFNVSDVKVRKNDEAETLLY